MQVCLFIGNLTPEWNTEGILRQVMEQFGKVERAVVMRNHQGQPKVQVTLDGLFG